MKFDKIAVIFILFFAAAALTGCFGGDGGGGGTAPTSSSATDDVTISGRISSAVVSPAPTDAAAAPSLLVSKEAMAAAKKAPSNITMHLINYKTSRVLSTSLTDTRGGFSFAGNFRGLTLSLLVANTTSEIIIGKVPANLPAKTSLSVSEPFDNTGGLDEYALIASNLIKQYNGADLIELSPGGVSKFWDIVSQTEVSTTAYLAANPLKTIRQVLAETSVSGSATSGQLVRTVPALSRPLAKFAITSDGPKTQGYPLTITVRAYDSSENSLDNYQGEGSIEVAGASGTITFSGTGIRNDGNNRATFFSNAFTNGYATVIAANESVDVDRVLTISEKNYGVKSSATISWTSKSLHHISISEVVSPVVAGSPVRLTLRAYDEKGAFIDSYYADATLADSTGTITALTPVKFEKGIWTGDVIMTRAASGINITAVSGQKSASSNRFEVIAGSAVKLMIASQPSTFAAAGQALAIQPQVGVCDTYENLIVGDNSTLVTAERGSLGGGTIEGTLVVKAQNGVATFKDLKCNKAEEKKIRFTAPGLFPVESATITITSEIIDRLELAVSDPQQAGSPVTIAISARDAYGNQIKNYSSSGTVAIGGATGTLTWSGTGVADIGGGKASYSPGSFSNGVATITVVDTAADSNMPLTVTDVSQPSPITTTISWVTGALHHFDISLENDILSAGEKFNATIVARDAYSNRLDNFTSYVAVSDSTGTIKPDRSGNFTGGSWTGSFSITAATSATTITVSAAGKTGKVDNVRVNAGSAVSYIVSPIASTAVDKAFPVSLSLQDVYGNPLSTSDHTPIDLSSISGKITFYSDPDKNFQISSISLLNGYASFYAADQKAGNADRITVSDASGRTGYSNAFSVAPGMQTRLAMLRQPSPQSAAGQAFLVQPQVAVLDPYGNVVTTDGTTEVTADYGTEGSQAPTGTLKVKVSSGIATFTDLGYCKAENLKIRFASGALEGVESERITVISGQAAQLMLITQPSDRTSAGQILPVQPRVGVFDPYGNLISSDNTTFISAESSAGGAMPGQPGMTVSGGIAAFSGLYFNAAGEWRVRFRSTQLQQAESDIVTVDNGALDHFGISVSNSSEAGNAIILTVSARDAQGNVVPNYASAGAISIAGASGNIIWTGTGVVNGAAGVATYDGSGFVNGSATINVTSTAAEFNRQVTITDNATGKSGTTFVSWTPGGLDNFRVVMDSAAVKAGTQIPVTIYARDSFGNVLTNYTTNVNISDTTNTISPNVSGLFSNGVWNGNIMFKKSSTDVTVTVSANGKTGECGPFTVLPGPAARLYIAQAPSSSSGAGVPFAVQPQITLFDSNGNQAVNDGSTQVVAERGSVGTAALQGVTSVTAVGGIVSFTDLSYPKAENMKIRFKSGSIPVVESDTIAVSTGALHHFDLTSNSPQESGNFITVTVTARDIAGNVFTSYSSAGTIAASGASGTINMHGAGVTDNSGGSGSFDGSGFVSGVAMFAISDSVADSPVQVFVTDGATGKTGVAALTWSPGNLDHFNVTINASAVSAGVDFPMSISARDQRGNIMNTFNGTVSLTDSTGTIYPIGSGQFTAGVWNGNARITRAASNVTVTATSSGKTGTATIAKVDPGAVKKIAITRQPSVNAQAGQVFAVQPQATLYDAYDNLATNDNSTVVSAERAGSGTAALQGALTATASAGIVNFNGLYYNRAEILKIRLQTPAAGSAESDNVNVARGPAASLTVIRQPYSQAIAGQTIVVQPQVAVTDAYGNVVTDDNATVITAARGAGTSAITGTLTATAVNGVATFAGLGYNKAENMTMAFSAGGLSNTESATVTVSSAAAAKIKISRQPSAAGNAGVPFSTQPQVGLYDVFDNLVTSDGSSVITAQVGSAGTPGSLAGGLAITVSGGVASFADLFHKKAENLKISFTSGTFAAVESDLISNGPGPAAKMTITRQPSSATLAGAAFAVQPQISLFDSYDNPVSSDNSTYVTVEAGGDATDVMRGTVTVKAVSGIVNFSNISYNKAESIKASFSSPGIPSIESSVLTIQKGPAAKIIVLRQPSTQAIAGQAFSVQPQVGIADSAGNLIETDSVTVVTAVRGLTGSFAVGGTGGVTAANGIVTYSNLSYSRAENLSLNFSAPGLTGAESDLIAVIPSSANKIAVLRQPSATANAGQAFGIQPQIGIYDSFNNLITSDNVSTVTAATGSVGSQSVQGSTTVTVSAGVATFTDLYYTKTENLVIKFDSGSFAAVEAALIDVKPGYVDHFVFSLASPQNNTVPFTGTDSLTAYDEFGNIKTDFSASSDYVYISIETGFPGTISGLGASSDYVLNQVSDFVNGVADLSGKMTFTSGNVPGNWKFKATSSSGKFGISPTIMIN